MAYVLSQDDLEALARVANTEVGHFYSRGYSDWAPAVNAVFDTVVNRIGSRQGEFARDRDVSSALNRRSQFSAVSGNRNAAGSWQALPATSTTRQARAVRDQIGQVAIARAAGAPSPIAGALHFGNPTRSVLERVGASRDTIARMQDLEQNATARYGRGINIHVHGTSAPYAPFEGSVKLGPELAAALGYGNPETGAARGLLPDYITGNSNAPVPTAKPQHSFGVNSPERASQRPGARMEQAEALPAVPTVAVDRGILGDLTSPAARAANAGNFAMGTPERASQRAGARDMAVSDAPTVVAAPVEAVTRGALRDITPSAPSRGLLDGFGDLTGARAGLVDAGSRAGLSIGSAPGVSRARDVSMAEFAGVAAPSAPAQIDNASARQSAVGAVPAVAAAPAAPAVSARASGIAGAGSGAVGTYSGTINQRDDERRGLMADFAQPGVEMPRSVDGLLGALGAPMSVRAAVDQRQRQERAALPGIDEDIAPVLAPAMPARQAVPALEAPRSIGTMAVREAPTAADVRTIAGAVPEVAQNVARYGLNPDPGPGRAYGYSPWGSGVSISYATAPDRIRDAGTGPGLFGAFKDTFGLDLTPSAGLMTGPLAMGLDAAGGAGLFSLGNMLGGSKALVDKFDVVDRATRDRVDGPQRSSSGGLLGAVSDPFGMARNELGGLFGWGGGQSAQPSASNFGGESGGFFGGIGDLLGSIFGGGGGGPADPNSRSGQMGGEGSSSARGFR